MTQNFKDCFLILWLFPVIIELGQISVVICKGLESWEREEAGWEVIHGFIGVGN